MSHPFKVGKTYRNRVGEFVVQEIDDEEMTIRYVGGGSLTTNVYLQARIWENIQFEEQMAREDERRRLAQEARVVARKRAAREKREKARPRFSGFQESDFEAKKRGIAWSSRKELGALLAHELSQRIEGEFSSWIVPRKSEVHVARKDRYDAEGRETNAAFSVAVDENGPVFGLVVGKPSGKVKADWPWSVLLAALADNDKVRRAVRAAMRANDLVLDVYAMDVRFGQVGKIEYQARGFLWTQETADQDVTKRMNWPDVVDYLQTVAPTKRCILYLRRRTPPAVALKAGAAVSMQMVDLFEALAPIYDEISAAYGQTS